MTRPPDRLLTTVIASRGRTGVNYVRGSQLRTGRARPVVARAALGALRATGLIAVVFNGDDTDTVRPAVLWCLWVGAAVPANGVDYDMRYPVTL